MTLRDLDEGTKVDIRILQKINRGGILIDDQRHYASTIHHIGYDGTLELTMPLRRGKLVLIPQGNLVELIFSLEDGGMVKSTAEISGRIRKGKNTVLRTNLISPIEKCQRREYYRLNCMIDVQFILLEDEETRMNYMADIVTSLNKRSDSLVYGGGTITNISGGGIRFITEEPLANENEYLFLRFYVTNGGNNRLVEFVGHVVGREKVGDGRHYAYRTKILFKDSHCQEKIIRYIFDQERLTRRKEMEVYA